MNDKLTLCLANSRANFCLQLHFRVLFVFWMEEVG